MVVQPDSPHLRTVEFQAIRFHEAVDHVCDALYFGSGGFGIALILVFKHESGLDRKERPQGNPWAVFVLGIHEFFGGFSVDDYPVQTISTDCQSWKQCESIGNPAHRIQVVKQRLHACTKKMHDVYRLSAEGLQQVE
ncbi:MAG: hypothetical protein PHT39_09350 [Sphaerochaetaceae bacterium]|nr:hypothetical protein [Sphaerochaetaceae bacterium]